MTPYSIWIWKNTSDNNKSLISWLSSDQYGTVETDLLISPDDLRTGFSKQLRNQQVTLSLTELLGHKITDTVDNWLINLASHQFLRIHFLGTLPEQWHAFPLEYCQHNKGHPLSEKIQIIRHAPLPKDALAQSMTKTIMFFNLWPENEYKREFFQPLEEITKDKNHVNLRRKKKKCNAYLKEHDLSSHSMLCVIAHGNEDAIEKPLQAENGAPWSLHTTPLPPLVIFLACGGEHNLRHYALKLLQKSPQHYQGITAAYGAKTVLIATDKLNAENASYFIVKFIKQWEAGQPVGCILRQLQSDDNARHTAKRLQIIGQGDLRQRIKEENESHDGDYNTIVNWKTLKMAACSPSSDQDDALCMLLDQLTRHCLVKYASVERVVEKLYQALGHDYRFNNPYEKKSLVYDPLERVYAHCNRITKAWLSYFMMYLSAMHDHDQITFYNDEVIKHQSVDLPHKAIFIFYAATAKYRQRNHVKAIQFVIEGFRLVAREREKSKGCGEAEYKLAELSINLLIDVSFAPIATYFVKHTDRCIQALTGEQYENESFTQLDRKARLAIRVGDVEDNEQGEAGLKQCVRKLDKKRYISNGNGNRELSFLLICSSWLDVPKKSYREETLKVLEPVNDIIKAIIHQSGNIEELYLLKGLANWAWRQEDQDAIHLLKHYRSTLIALCEQTNLHDAGPLGSIIACMRLIDKEDKAIKQAWINITEKMHEQFHYFELTLFYALMDEEKKSAAYYKEFREQQETILDTLKQLEPTILGKEFYEALLLTEKNFFLLPMNTEGTTLSADLDDIRRYGIVPF